MADNASRIKQLKGERVIILQKESDGEINGNIPAVRRTGSKGRCVVKIQCNEREVGENPCVRGAYGWQR